MSRQLVCIVLQDSVVDVCVVCSIGARVCREGRDWGRGIGVGGLLDEPMGGYVYKWKDARGIEGWTDSASDDKTDRQTLLLPDT